MTETTSTTTTTPVVNMMGEAGAAAAKEAQAKAEAEAVASATTSQQTQQEGDAASKAAADEKAKAEADKNKAETDKGEEGPNGVPDGGYKDFTYPEGAQADPKLLESAHSLFKDLNLSQSGAQKLIDYHAAQMAAGVEQQKTAFEQTVNEWAEKSKADPEIGGANLEANLATAKKALDAYGDPELKEALTHFGFGNHPAFIRFALKVGKEIGSDPIVKGNTAQVVRGNASAAEVMFPSMRKN